MRRPIHNTNIRAPRAVPRTTGTTGRPRSGSGKTLATAAGWLTLIFTTVAPSVFTPLEERTFTGAYGTNTATRVLKLTLLAWGLITVLRHSTALRSLMHELNQFFLAFLVIVPVSYLWSISPGDTLARFVTILAIVAVWLAICLASWEPLRFQDILRPVTTFLILGSIVFVMISPELAIEKGEGTLKDAWHGLAAQKNGFGQLSSFGFIFWLHGWLARQVKTWKALVFGGCAEACILFSRSSTSLLASTFVAVFLLMLMRAPASWRRIMPYLIAGFAVIVLTYALAVLKLVPGLDVLLEPIMALTGKDMTFSNRSVIWDIIKEHIQLSPYIGSGYGAYWIGPDPASPSYSFFQRMYFYPTESHNGYLEIVNDLGFMGLVVLCGYFFLYVRQAVRLLRFDHDQGALYLALFFQQAIINLSESCWLSVNAGLSFTIMTFATISLARSALDQRAGAPSPTLRPPGQASPRRVFR
jgi:exopolysaccharide production protein ExoQ